MGYQPRSTKPGYTGNGTLKAMLQYHQHQVGLMEEQEKIIDSLSVAIVASEKRNTLLIQQGQQGGMESQLLSPPM